MDKLTATHLQGTDKLSLSGNTVVPANIASLTKYYNSDYVDHTCVPGIYINMVLSEGSQKQLNTTGDESFLSLCLTA